jgi:hypothetical protein
MPQDPLLREIAQRTRTFSAGTGVSLTKIAKLIDVEPGNFSAFVNHRIGLSAASTVKLLQLLNLTKRQVEESWPLNLSLSPIFRRPEKRWPSRSVLPLHRQNNLTHGCQHFLAKTLTGPMTLPRLKRRYLPNADDYQQKTIDFLRDQQNIHRSAIKAIDDYLAGVQRGKVNITGTKGPARSVPSNTTSRTPGQRGDLL